MIYDTIGRGYTRSRQPDPRFTAALIDALVLPTGSLVADIGAGTGNYARELSTHGLRVIAVEPSATMRAQRDGQAGVDWLAASAEHLPLKQEVVDGAFCMLSAHHFTDLGRAMEELDRVIHDGPLVLFTFDPRSSAFFWLQEYFPTVWRESFDFFPPIADVAALITERTGRGVTLTPFLLPWDVRDAVAAAGWRRPELYLDTAVRSGMSPFALSDQGEIEGGVAALKRDLANGAWQRANAPLLELDALDVGYRIIVAR